MMIQSPANKWIRAIALGALLSALLIVMLSL